MLLRASIKKMTPKKSAKPSAKTLVQLLETKLREYVEASEWCEALTDTQEEVTAVAAVKSARPSTSNAVTSMEAASRPKTVDSSIDMDLTPSWWHV